MGSSDVQPPSTTIAARAQSAGNLLIAREATGSGYPIGAQRTERPTAIASSSVMIPSNR
ncbi:hypothetical protein GCM10025331_44800 [Actinoplanes utahensis]|nr:hypothetical protein Aut01nite_29490 [Actinoplanes utahensis]